MISFQSFSNEFEKLARIVPPADLAVPFKRRVDIHHDSDVKDWASFEKGLKALGFQKAVLNHPESDAKLKEYVKNFGGYIKSKDVVGTVPSRTSSVKHKIKRLSSGRLACGCGDWQYVHSVKGTDCDHIEMLRASGKEKKSSIVNGIRLARKVDTLKSDWKEGKAAKEITKKVNQTGPKKSWDDRIEDVAAIGHALL